jgi:carbohydrate-binding DOMON domain-containing protein
MDKQKGYRQPGDVGGPMNIGEGYRWNIPTLTYGFSRSFIDYFGSNGVAAIESAITILNSLPPASSLDPQAIQVMSGE